MKPKVSYMLVGAFVLLLGAAIVATIVWLSSAGSDASYRTYVAYVSESVAGLSVNADVSYNGVDVGRVRAIALDPTDPQRVRIEMEIADDTPVKTDTLASLASSGITGVAHVELSGGTAESEPLRPAEGEEFPVIATRPSLFVRLDSSISTLIDKLGGAADSLTQVADRVELLLDDQNREAIAGILENVEQFTAELESVTAEARTFSANLTAASAELPGLMTRAEQTMIAFEESAVSLEAAGADISATAVALQESVDGVAGGVDRLLSDLTPFSRGVPSRLVNLVDELQLLASTLRSLSQDVDRSPEMLIFGRRDVVRGPGE
jgi:phospholipid/cholesterol/gamma-HCH transport system substrate-binding protein